MAYARALELPVRSSAFLFGPRQTGKSTLARTLVRKNDLFIDLLPEREFLALAKQPGRFRDEVVYHLERHPGARVFVDEIQKLPSLLGEVHELIESRGARFVLTGSNARKLKRVAANMLAGRAWTYRLFPLTADELGRTFELERALRFGTLPKAWTHNRTADVQEFLRSYVHTYLREEIREEGLLRSIGPFTAFLDVVAVEDGSIVNYSSVARECGVSVKTVQAYYEILEDTFIAYRVPAWRRSRRKQLIAHPRYYLFDCGVTNALAHTLDEDLNRETRGRRFEQFFLGQLLATLHYRRLDRSVHFWRTNHGAEVDFVLAKGQKMLAGIEIKSGHSVSRADLSGLLSFREEYPNVPCFVVGVGLRPREVSPGITAIDWREFLRELGSRVK